MSSAGDFHQEYLGISLVRVVKELAGRIRVLEEVIRSRPELAAEYERQAHYQAAYEEDEYVELINEIREVLSRLPEVAAGE